MDKQESDKSPQSLLRNRKPNEKTTSIPNTTISNEQKPFYSQNTFDDALYMVISLALGFSFGFILEKSKVYEPKSIRQQMIFNKFIMMKMFFTALATSMSSILLMSVLFRERYNKVLESYRETLKTKSLLIISAGGLILGLGMQTSGSCPGMMYIQLGAGVGYSFITLIGGLTGALVHGLLNSYLTQATQPDPIASKTFYEIFNIKPVIARIALIALLYVGVIVMEYCVPWYVDYKVDTHSHTIFSAAWSPIVAGAFLGSLQFFSLLFLSKSLGASSSFTTFVSLFFSNETLNKYPYLKRFSSGKGNYATIMFIFGSIFGSFLSAKSSGVYGQVQSVHPYNAFIGGFLLVFGARLAGGCNTGHGISGTSHLFFGSFIAMICMFISGIALGLYAMTNDFFF